MNPRLAVPLFCRSTLALSSFAVFVAASGLRGQSIYEPHAISTLAGLSLIGSDDGNTRDAQFNRPDGMAADHEGNFFVADSGNHTIRKIGPEGTVTTWAGSAGASGSVDGRGSGARFNTPRGLAVDTAGNLYVADTGNSTIRKIDPEGNVTTFAGFPLSASFADGQGSAARFSAPVGLAVDGTGNVLVADKASHTIRKISSSGFVTTLAGLFNASGSTDGIGNGARFKNPEGVTVDGAGVVYVADTGNSTIRRITPNGAVTTLAGFAGFAQIKDGIGAAARFTTPRALTVDGSGNLLVAEYESLRKVTPAGLVVTFAGVNLAEAGHGIVGGAEDNVHVTSVGRHSVLKVTPAGVVTIFAGQGRGGTTDGSGKSARFYFSREFVLFAHQNSGNEIAVDADGNTYVADAWNSTIRKITPSGEVTTLAGLAGHPGHADGVGAEARFETPSAVAVDRDGNLFVVDATDETVRKVAPDGTVTTVAGARGRSGTVESIFFGLPIVAPGRDGVGAAASFGRLVGVTVDGNGLIYVMETSGGARIRTVTQGGFVSSLAGSSTQIGSADGFGSSARFTFSRGGLGVDEAGNIYVADSSNSTIRKMTPQGFVTTIAGHAGSPGAIDAVGGSARFRYPGSVAVDPNGNIYVADNDNYLVRKITPQGEVTTLAGLAESMGSRDGVAQEARFTKPSSIAVDRAGRVYIADNNAIRVADVPTVAFTSAPRSVAAGRGGTVVLSAAATSQAPVTYRWHRDGVQIPGAAGPSLVLGNVDETSAGLYTVVASNAFGTATSAAAQLTVVDGGTSRISNMSVRARIDGGQTLIAGAVTSGPKELLIRAIGPTLRSRFALQEATADPAIRVFSEAGAQLDQNDNWNPGLSAAFGAVGAFPLDPGSRDAALRRTIAGPNTAHVTASDPGVVLVELYDSELGSASRLVNVSARNRVGIGADILIPGFVIEGSVGSTLLIRAVGPSLQDLHGIPGTLADPRLELFDRNGVRIAENDDWDPSLSPIFSRVGAFQLPHGSRDAVLLVTLPPGPYTAHVSGVAGGTGEALVEVYEVP